MSKSQRKGSKKWKTAIRAKIKIRKPARSANQRNWCFTSFKDLDWDTVYMKNGDMIRYIGWGPETCPDTKKWHQQGWIQFVNAKRMNSIKKMAEAKELHLEPCYGTVDDNEAYISKECKPEEVRRWGSFKRQGQRTDVEMVKKDIDDGKDMLEVAENNFGYFVKHSGGLLKYRELKMRSDSNRIRPMHVTFVTGPTGVGKTRWAMEEAEKYGNYYIIKGACMKWWNGYEYQKTLIIDEFANDLVITAMLNVLDEIPLRLNVKNTFVYANWERVIITSNLKREEVYPDDDIHIDAFWRRVHKIRDYWLNGNANPWTPPLLASSPTPLPPTPPPPPPPVPTPSPPPLLRQNVVIPEMIIPSFCNSDDSEMELIFEDSDV